MPTAAFSSSRLGEARAAVEDTRTLLALRIRSGGRGSRAAWAAAILAALTLSIAVVPAFTPGAGAPGPARHLAVLIPTGLAGVLLLNVLAAIASGGGRELLPRDQATPYPLSPTTDHLGALVLAPLNVAWIVQAWALLGTLSYGLGSARVATSAVLGLCWLAFATTAGQLVAWGVETVRRGSGGIVLVRAAWVLLFAGAMAVHLTGNTVHVLDQLPTRWFLGAAVSGWSLRWWTAIAALLAGATVATIVGAVLAGLAGRRLPRDEARLETGLQRPRKMPRTVVGALVQLDRGSIWRSVPMRRGILTLAIGPAAVAAFTDLDWSTMIVFPALVASGGALLFGVNAWCLDGRGALWRESLPASATDQFDARTLVLAEFLGAATALTAIVCGLRAGAPTAAECAAMICVTVVSVVQVTAASLRWSLAHPYAADLRSARATPAPPATMAGYAARLAVSTTLTSMLFSTAVALDQPWLAVNLAVPCLAWSTYRWRRARAQWDRPEVRARVVRTVAA